MKGTVKFFNRMKGFGFIAGEDGKEYFVHKSGLKEESVDLNENDAVTFDVEEGDRGPKAANVAKEGSEASVAEEGSKADDTKEGSEADDTKEGSKADDTKEGSKADDTKEGSE